MKSLVGVGFLWSSFCVFFMLIYEHTGKLKWFMPLIDYTKDSKWYYIFNGMHQTKYGDQAIYLLIFIDIIVFIAAGIYLIKQNSAKKLLIIEHTSLQRINFSYVDEEMQEYSVKKFPINQYKTISNNSLTLEDKIALLITEIENVLPQIYNYVDQEYQIGYAGIPVGNIPCVFLLGYKLDDANKKLYLHKNRSDALDDNFHILKDEPSAIKLVSEIKPNNGNQKGNVMVIIQLTQPIKDDDLVGLLKVNDYILRYSIPNQINYDIVNSARQTNSYVDQIVNDIAEAQKGDNISEIKICVAASSDFIFALGTKFSKTQNKDTVVYQFDGSRYSWGINVKKGTAVIITD